MGESDIIRYVDAVLMSQASVDLRAVTLLRPGKSAWGLLLGHRRGRRVFVERLFPAGTGAALPPPERFEELDRLFGRRIVGLYAVRPSATFKASLLAPYFYGRLFLDLQAPKGKGGLRPYVIDFRRAFVLAGARLETGAKGGSHE